MEGDGVGTGADTVTDHRPAHTSTDPWPSWLKPASFHHPPTQLSFSFWAVLQSNPDWPARISHKYHRIQNLFVDFLIVEA